MFPMNWLNFYHGLGWNNPHHGNPPTHLWTNQDFTGSHPIVFFSGFSMGSVGCFGKPWRESWTVRVPTYHLLFSVDSWDFKSWIHYSWNDLLFLAGHQKKHEALPGCPWKLGQLLSKLVYNHLLSTMDIPVKILEVWIFYHDQVVQLVNRMIPRPNLPGEKLGKPGCWRLMYTGDLR